MLLWTRSVALQVTPAGVGEGEARIALNTALLDDGVGLLASSFAPSAMSFTFEWMRSTLSRGILVLESATGIRPPLRQPRLAVNAGNLSSSPWPCRAAAEPVGDGQQCVEVHARGLRNEYDVWSA